jgi:hypothetical protein
MTTETKIVYDVLVSTKEAKGLRKIGTAFVTQKGTGCRCTLKSAVEAGAQLFILPSRPFGEHPQPAGEAQG